MIVENERNRFRCFSIMKNVLRRTKSENPTESTARNNGSFRQHEALNRQVSEPSPKVGLFDKIRNQIRRASLRDRNRSSHDEFSTGSVVSQHRSFSLRDRRLVPRYLTLQNNSDVSSQRSSTSSIRQSRRDNGNVSPAEISVFSSTPPKVPIRSPVSLGLVPMSGSPRTPSSSSGSPMSPLQSEWRREGPPLTPSSPLSSSPFHRTGLGRSSLDQIAEIDHRFSEGFDLNDEDPPENQAPPPPNDLLYRPEDESFSITNELRKLAKCGWYWGPISRSEAEERLQNQPDGTFLVRNSLDRRYLLSLSFRSLGQTLHARIEYFNGRFSFHPQLEIDAYPSVVELVESAMKKDVACYSRNSTAPDSPSYPVRLINPVNRFAEVRSLKYLCRFVVRLHIRADYLAQIQLPPSIRKFLSSMNN